MEITLNKVQRLFIIPAGDGYTTAGFDYVFKQLKTLREKLAEHGIHIQDVCAEDIGTLQQYQQYREAFGKIGSIDLGTWFSCDTPPQVRSIIERYRRNGKHIRIFYGDPVTGRDWMEEYDMLGRVGRSMGPMKIPLLITPDEDGGPGMLDDRIIRIIDVDSGKELYRHASYHQGDFDIRPAECGNPYTHGVWIDGKNHANFRSYGKAAQWIAFMTGECFRQPA